MIRVSARLLAAFIVATAIAYVAYWLFGWLGLFAAAFLVVPIVVAAVKRELPQS